MSTILKKLMRNPFIPFYLKATSHCLETLCQQIQEIDLKKQEPSIKKRENISESQLNQNNTINKIETQITQKSKMASQGNSKSQYPPLQDIQNQIPISSKFSQEEQSTKAVYNNESQKKRKAGATEEISQAVGKDKELKKIKLTQQSKAFELKAADVIEIEDDDEPPVSKQTQNQAKEKSSQIKDSKNEKVSQEKIKVPNLFPNKPNIVISGEQIFLGSQVVKEKRKEKPEIINNAEDDSFFAKVNGPEEGLSEKEANSNTMPVLSQKRVTQEKSQGKLG